MHPMKTTAPALSGYPRADGRKGIRNVIVVAYLVECAHHVAREITLDFRHLEGDVQVHLVGFPGCFPNSYAERMMTAIATHPNVGAALLVSLGCESMNKRKLEQAIADSGRPVATLTIQQRGGTRSTIAEGVAWSARDGGRAGAPDARADGAERTGGGHHLRRLGRHQRHQRQPGRGPRLRHADRGRRHLYLRRNRRAGGLRVPHEAPCRHARAGRGDRGLRQQGRALLQHHGAWQLRARQRRRRPVDHRGKIAGAYARAAPRP